MQEIRLRGPFVSLAHFVNRTGITGSPSSSASGWLNTEHATVETSGALQTAIERAGINATAFPSSIPQDAVDVVNTTGNGATRGPPMADALPKTTPSALTVPGACVTLSKSTGIPGWLTQADLLQALGPALAARSDTFVIRSYGEALDPINTGSTVVPANILSRAWCEAVVQRFPDYADVSNPASVDPSGPAGSGTTITAANQKFGRKFRIVALRWLSPNDI